MVSFLEKIIGSYSQKKIKKYRPLVEKINQQESKFKNFTQNDCQEKTAEFKGLLQENSDGKGKKVNLDDLLVEAFALTRKAAHSAIGERHFDVQLLGGMALHGGAIAEMKTGEGKTLTSTLPAYLNSLTAKGVHIVTVNEYLAKRDSEWMGQIFNYLGLNVGLIYNDMSDELKKQAYLADITYGTNNEFGFDYLRDNMKYNLDSLVQRKLNYAIIDEIDSILIDEARTPLIISGPAEDQSSLYRITDRAVLGLTRAFTKEENPRIDKIAEFKKVPESEVEKVLQDLKASQVVTSGDFSINEKNRSIQLTEQGIEKVEQRLEGNLKSPSLFDFENIELLHLINQSLKARYTFKKDVDYVVSDGEVKIVDEFTGRIMEGRRFSDGLHQALECKEGVQIEKENQTLASITFQNYFRKYQKISGMTGTALTEEKEFIKIYNLGVIEIPTNEKMIRGDANDAIYKTQKAKYSAVVKQVQSLYNKEQPVLLGTDSVASSELLSTLLKSANLPHQVLNAKQHEKEAQIIAEAGKKKAITLSTNMAGRGTDIKLGEGVRELGGLFVLGTAKHDSRRVDNQLRGRSGRQGDPGNSKFFLSLEDDLLRTFGGDRISKLMDTMKIDENEVIEHALISRSIINAQKKVEGQNFNIRKHLLEYDDVLNQQREVIYQKRKEMLTEEDNSFSNIAANLISNFVSLHCPEKQLNLWNLAELAKQFKYYFTIDLDLSELEKMNKAADIEDKLIILFENLYKQKKEYLADLAPAIERHLLVVNTDYLWKEHLLHMDYLKEGIGLRGFGQKNPLDEYKREAFELFSEMLDKMQQKCVFDFFHLKLEKQSNIEFNEPKEKNIKLLHGNETSAKEQKPKIKPITKAPKLGRNSLCYCGSGKKYKSCCLHKDSE